MPNPRNNVSLLLGALVVGVAMLSMLTIVQHSLADPPEWPLVNPIQNTICNPSDVTCATCPGNFAGCTSPVPAGWSIGNCIEAVNPSCNASAFNCGAAYNCTTHQPTGGFCQKPFICS